MFADGELKFNYFGVKVKSCFQAKLRFLITISKEVQFLTSAVALLSEWRHSVVNRIELPTAFIACWHSNIITCLSDLESVLHVVISWIELFHF